MDDYAAETLRMANEHFATATLVILCNPLEWPLRADLYLESRS